MIEHSPQTLSSEGKKNHVIGQIVLSSGDSLIQSPHCNEATKPNLLPFQLSDFSISFALNTL